MSDKSILIKSVLEKAGIDGSTEVIPTFQNIVARVETDTKTVFLKIFTDEPYLAKKLSSLYPLLKKKGVPVPDVLYAETEGDTPAVILSAIPGETLGEARKGMSDAELEVFYEELGEDLARIHSITFDRFGESIDGETVIAAHEYSAGPFDSWKRMHEAIIAHRLSHLQDSALADMIEPLRTYFREHTSLIDYPIVPRLLHIDLNQKNIFVKEGHISGIIDFDGSFIGHNEEELMRTASANFPDNPRFRDAFFRGYTKRIPLDEGYERRRPFYFLSRMLVHADCLILFGTTYKEHLDEEFERVKKEILSVIAGNNPDYNTNK